MNKGYNPVKLKVDIIREIWSSKDGSFIVYIANDEAGKPISINCSGFELRPGKTIVVGQRRIYKGKDTFKCDYEEFDSTSYDAKYNLLCSIDGIKDKTARKILDGIPDHDIEIFYKKDIPKIKGVGRKTIEKLHEGLNFLKENKDLKTMIAAIGQNLSANKIREINEYLADSEININEFLKDPYNVMIDEFNIAFKRVDYIAQKHLKCDKNLKSRLLFLTEEIVKNITGFGHTYTSIDEFNKKVGTLGLDESIINKLMYDEGSRVVNHDSKVQVRDISNYEKKIPEYLKCFQEKDRLTDYEMENVKITLRQYEKENKITLHEKQREAVLTSLNNNCVIICGGAGTGKSTIIKAIIFILQKLNNFVVCTAPTGKASRRITEVTGHKAYTCHRFYMSEENSVDELEWETSLKTTMIIDETSMIDTQLCYKILKNMLDSKASFNRIILVGDPGQLPSVGAGAVMADILKSEKIKTVELTNTFRQGKDSNILKMADKVRENQPIEKIKENDFFFNCPVDLDNYIVRCFLHQWKLKKDMDTFYNEFQICTSSRKRAVEINIAIKRELKNRSFQIAKKEIEFGINDKIMCIKNDSKNDVYNGEFGRIISMSYRTNELTDRDDDIICDNSLDLFKLYQSGKFIKDSKFQVYYKELDKVVSYDLDFDEIANFQLSYCCTIHKLQGSEFKTVICDVSEFNIITDNRLLYTAITRAKKKFILLSNSVNTVDKIIYNKISSKRNTLLLDKMLREWSEEGCKKRDAKK